MVMAREFSNLPREKLLYCVFCIYVMSFKVDLPGIKKEEVKVEFEDGRVMQISGERSREQEDTNDKWHRVEMSSGKFIRRLMLPENTKIDQVKVAMEKRVLTVIVCKEEKRRKTSPCPHHLQSAK
ncbi:hypothetical protein ACFX13_008735 [Malus domestica]